MPAKNRVRTPETLRDQTQPAQDQPGRHIAVVLHGLRGSPRPLLAVFPEPHAQQDNEHNSVQRILMIGNQLYRQQRERASRMAALEPGNLDSAPATFRKQIDRPTPVAR